MNDGTIYNRAFNIVSVVTISLIALSLVGDVFTTYTCIGAIIFAIVGGIDRLLLIALTAYSFVHSKKAKND